MNLFTFLFALYFCIGSGIGFGAFWLSQDTWWSATLGLFMWLVSSGIALLVMHGWSDSDG